MRTIKFRVWNGTEMVYDVIAGKFGTFYVNPENGGLDPNDSASLNPLNTKYPDDIPLMQFTGLVDKNGKEIYEGDIVKCKEATEPEERGFICLIKDYRLKFNNVNWIEDEFYGPVNYDYISQKTEIIGNIFETPELIIGAF